MRNLGLEALRGIAAFGIVACHLDLLPLTSSGWALRALCDMNVGLFAALSGYLMFTRSADTPFFEYVRQRAHRLLPVYFLWTLLYILFGLVFDAAIRHSLNPKWFDPAYYPSIVFQGRAAGHLWFLISLFYCQVLFHPLQRVLNTVGRPRVAILLELMIGFGCVTASAFLRDFWYGTYLLRPFGFLVSGCAIAAARAQVPEERSFVPFAQVFWGIVTVLTIGIHYVFAGRIPVFIRDWFVAIPLLLLFLGASRVFARPSLATFARLLGVTSLGVYLIHPVFAQVFKQIFIRIYSSPFGPIPLALSWFGTWLCAFLATLVFMRLKNFYLRTKSRRERREGSRRRTATER